MGKKEARAKIKQGFRRCLSWLHVHPESKDNCKGWQSAEEGPEAAAGPTAHLGPVTGRNKPGQLTLLAWAEGPGLTDSALMVAGTCVHGCVHACMRVQGCLSLHFIWFILMTSKTHPSLDRKLGELSLQHISEAHPRKGPAGPAAGPTAAPSSLLPSKWLLSLKRLGLEGLTYQNHGCYFTEAPTVSGSSCEAQHIMCSQKSLLNEQENE